jgi:polar amino acid transport system substrate-binding protein
MIPFGGCHKIDMVNSGMTITPERQEKISFPIPCLKINQSHRGAGQQDKDAR